MLSSSIYHIIQFNNIIQWSELMEDTAMCSSSSPFKLQSPPASGAATTTNKNPSRQRKRGNSVVQQAALLEQTALEVFL